MRVRWLTPTRDGLLRLSNGGELHIGREYIYTGPHSVDLAPGVVGMLERDRGRIDFVYEIGCGQFGRHQVFDLARQNVGLCVEHLQPNSAIGRYAD